MNNKNLAPKLTYLRKLYAPWQLTQMSLTSSNDSNRFSFGIRMSKWSPVSNFSQIRQEQWVKNSYHNTKVIDEYLNQLRVAILWVPITASKRFAAGKLNFYLVLDCWDLCIEHVNHVSLVHI